MPHIIVTAETSSGWEVAMLVERVVDRVGEDRLLEDDHAGARPAVQAHRAGGHERGRTRGARPRAGEPGQFYGSRLASLPR